MAGSTIHIPTVYPDQISKGVKIRRTQNYLQHNYKKVN